MRAWIRFKELIYLIVCINHQAVAELKVEFLEISPNKQISSVLIQWKEKKKMEQDVFDIETAAYDMAVDAALESEEGD